MSGFRRQFEDQRPDHDMGEPRTYREKRPPLEGSPAATYPVELGKYRERLDLLRWHHVELSRRFLAASDGGVYSIDLVLAGVMVRSYGLVDGFLDAFDGWNPVVAAPLLRLQLDSLVRVSYMVHAPSASDVADYIILGGEFRKLKDGEGKLLSDARLLHHAGPHHSWIGPVYDATSGWVHFSPAHVNAAFRLHRDEDGQPLDTFDISIPLPPERIPLSALEELIGAMIRATEQLFGYVEVWEQRKGLPLGEVRPLGTT